jgi:hypothetical protein
VAILEINVNGVIAVAKLRSFIEAGIVWMAIG